MSILVPEQGGQAPNLDGALEIKGFISLKYGLVWVYKTVILALTRMGYGHLLLTVDLTGYNSKLHLLIQIWLLHLLQCFHLVSHPVHRSIQHTNHFQNKKNVIVSKPQTMTINKMHCDLIVSVFKSGLRGAGLSLTSAIVLCLCARYST